MLQQDYEKLFQPLFFGSDGVFQTQIEFMENM